MKIIPYERLFLSKGVDGMTQRLLRADVPTDETWKLEDLFATAGDWQNELDAALADIASVAAYRGRLAEGAGMLLECFEAMERLMMRMLRVGTYAFLRFSEDGSNPVNQGMMGRMASAQAKVGSAIAFIEPEILALPEGAVEQYLQGEPGLGEFRRRLERILADRPYVLSQETEAALAALSEVFGAPETIYQLAKSGDMLFEPARDSEGREVSIAFATYEEKLEISPDAVLRRNAYSSFANGLKRYQNAFGGTFGSEIKKNVAMARVRGYESATHMLLHGQEVSGEFYHNLLQTVQAGLAPHMRRYVELRKRVLGLDQVMYCDIEAPLDPGFQSDTTYEEGARLILDSVQVMGDEYAQIVQSALEGRWIDRADNIGKSTGAFCAPVYDVHPYILATWGANMRSVFTIAHELGHAVHMVFSSRNQRLVNTDISVVFVEAPSTFNELLLAQHILGQKCDRQMRRWVLMQMLATYYHNFVRHMLEAELTRRVYALAEEGSPVTAALLSQLKGKILEEYWDGVVQIDNGARLTWMRQPHYYMGLYSYTYSAGLVTATLVAENLAQDGEAVAKRWVEVLKAGSTMKPLELAKMAGVDLEDEATVRRATDYVGRVVDELVQSF
jgi:oligoendopeptidase F